MWDLKNIWSRELLFDPSKFEAIVFVKTLKKVVFETGNTLPVIRARIATFNVKSSLNMSAWRIGPEMFYEEKIVQAVEQVHGKPERI